MAEAYIYTMLEDRRNNLLNDTNISEGQRKQNVLEQLIREICLFDSIHDFGPQGICYDKIPKSKSIQSKFGLFQPDLFSQINFTYVNDRINNYLENESLHLVLKTLLPPHLLLHFLMNHEVGQLS